MGCLGWWNGFFNTSSITCVTKHPATFAADNSKTVTLRTSQAFRKRSILTLRPELAVEACSVWVPSSSATLATIGYLLITNEQVDSCSELSTNRRCKHGESKHEYGQHFNRRPYGQPVADVTTNDLHVVNGVALVADDGPQPESAAAKSSGTSVDAATDVSDDGYDERHDAKAANATYAIFSGRLKLYNFY